MSLRDIALKQTTISAVMEGKTKISAKDLIDLYPAGVTVVDFDLLEGDKGLYCVVAFAEDHTRYLNGGKILTDIVKSWVSAYGDSVDEAVSALQAEGGVKMKFKLATTKNGKNITLVEIV